MLDEFKAERTALFEELPAEVDPSVYIKWDKENQSSEQASSENAGSVGGAAAVCVGVSVGLARSATAAIAGKRAGRA